jgi:hypothetical protein
MAGTILEAPVKKNAMTRELTTAVNNPSERHSITVEGGERSPVAVRQFKIFCVLWAIATLFHMAHSSVFDAQLNLALLTLASFYAIFRPSLASFIVLITLQIFDAAFRMPFTTNHWIFTAFANVTMLHVLLFLILRTRSFSVKPDTFYSTFAPLIRIEVIILYFFTVFHKLNAGFFAPDTSCATYLLQAQHIDQIIPLSRNIYQVNAYFTLIVETCIPLLLCFRRTVNLGVLVGLFFHCVLSYSSYNAFYDFSSAMFATYFLFISPAFTLKLSALYDNLRPIGTRLISEFSVKKLLSVCIMALLLVGFVYAFNHRLASPKSVHLYFFWTIYSLLFAGLFVYYTCSRKPMQQGSAGSPVIFHWSLYVIPALLFINGTLPYVGLKTENSFAMFSNLRTEGGQTNHFIIPVSAQIFDYQKDVVEIISSTDGYLQSLAEKEQALVLFEFRNYVHERKPAQVAYKLNGRYSVLRKEDKSTYEILGSNPYVARKLMKFRPFTLRGPQECLH